MAQFPPNPPPIRAVSLGDCFEHIFGPRHTQQFRRATLNYSRSVAAYSLATYLLAIKDRHNGNIMIDSEGRVIHIDFGFILSRCPGGFNFEQSPFKLTLEMADLMGKNSTAAAVAKY